MHKERYHQLPAPSYNRSVNTPSTSYCFSLSSLLTVGIKLANDGLDKSGLGGDMSPSYRHHPGWGFATLLSPFSVLSLLFFRTPGTTATAKHTHLTFPLSHQDDTSCLARITLHAV